MKRSKGKPGPKDGTYSYKVTAIKRKPLTHLRVKAYDGINRTPALPLALEGWYELHKKKQCVEVCMLGWETQALVAFQGQRAHRSADLLQG